MGKRIRLVPSKTPHVDPTLLVAELKAEPIATIKGPCSSATSALLRAVRK